MKIAIDISQTIYGTGVSVYTKNLVSSLISNFPQEDFLLFGGSFRRRGDLEKIARRLKTESVIYPYPPRVMDFIWNSLHVLPVEKLIGPVDLIHTSDWTEPPSALPKVTTVHDLIPFKFPQTTTDNIRQTHKKRLAWVARESSAIITVSSSTKKDLIELLKIPEEKIHVVYEGVESRYTPQPPAIIESIKRKYHLEEEYLFSLSTLEPRKNQNRLIEAYSQMKDKYPGLKLVLGGKTGWGEKIKPVDGVIMPGFIPDADLPALYSGCLSFVFPSFYEGFGLPPLEAMACGAAVVTSNVSSLPEVVGKAGILVDPNSTKSIKAGIIKAIKTRADLKAKAIKRASKFTWKETAQQTHRIYQQVIKQTNK